MLWISGLSWLLFGTSCCVSKIKLCSPVLTDSMKMGFMYKNHTTGSHSEVWSCTKAFEMLARIKSFPGCTNSDWQQDPSSGSRKPCSLLSISTAIVSSYDSKPVQLLSGLNVSNVNFHITWINSYLLTVESRIMLGWTSVWNISCILMMLLPVIVCEDAHPLPQHAASLVCDSAGNLNETRHRLSQREWRKAGTWTRLDSNHFWAEHQSFKLILWRRNNVLFHCFPPHCATLLDWYWCCGLWVGLLFTHYSLSRLPNPDELKWTQPLSPSQQLGVADFKGRDMNNQTVIFSFSSSCYWPDFMILSLPSLPPSLFHACSLMQTLFLSQHFSSSQSLSVPPALCRSPICTRSSSRFRIRGSEPTRRTTTDRLQRDEQRMINNGNFKTNCK